jgi:hypothetical protein
LGQWKRIETYLENGILLPDEPFFNSLIEDLGRPFDHADDWQQGAQGGDDGRHAEPAVHEQVSGLGSGV